MARYEADVQSSRTARPVRPTGVGVQEFNLVASGGGTKSLLATALTAPVLATAEGTGLIVEAFNRPQFEKARGQSRALEIEAQARADQAAADKLRQEVAVKRAFAFAVDQLTSAIGDVAAADHSVQADETRVEQAYAIQPRADPSAGVQARALASRSAEVAKVVQRELSGATNATQEQIEALTARAVAAAGEVNSIASRMKEVLLAAREAAFAAFRSPSDVLGSAWKPLGLGVFRA